MQAKRLTAILLFAVLAPICPAGHAQTDLAASVYGAFNGASSGNGIQQSPSNAAGILLELRHISNPLIGYEATYAYNRANQSYTNPTPPCPTGFSCGPLRTSVPANAHEVTGDWLVSANIASLKLFALAGGGLLFNVPAQSTVNASFSECGTNGSCQITSSSQPTKTSTQGVLVYGAGVDWTVLPHLGLRFQYRGNLYKASDLTRAFTSTNAFTHTSEPMLGAFLRF